MATAEPFESRDALGFGLPFHFEKKIKRLRVEVYFPDASIREQQPQLQQVQTAATHFVEVFGFRPAPDDEEQIVHSSWRWLRWFRSVAPLAKRETKELYEGMKEALRREHLDRVGAETFQARAVAAAELLKSMEPFQRAIVRLGDVVLAKAVVDGEQQLVIETLSPQVARMLEDRPELLKDPKAFIEFVKSEECQRLIAREERIAPDGNQDVLF